MNGAKTTTHGVDDDDGSRPAKRLCTDAICALDTRAEAAAEAAEATTEPPFFRTVRSLLSAQALARQEVAACHLLHALNDDLLLHVLQFLPRATVLCGLRVACRYLDGISWLCDHLTTAQVDVAHKSISSITKRRHLERLSLLLHMSDPRQFRDALLALTQQRASVALRSVRALHIYVTTSFKPEHHTLAGRALAELAHVMCYFRTQPQTGTVLPHMDTLVLVFESTEKDDDFQLQPEQSREFVRSVALLLGECNARSAGPLRHLVLGLALDAQRIRDATTFALLAPHLAPLESLELLDSWKFTEVQMPRLCALNIKHFSEEYFDDDADVDGGTDVFPGGWVVRGPVVVRGMLPEGNARRLLRNCRFLQLNVAELNTLRLFENETAACLTALQVLWIVEGVFGAQLQLRGYQQTMHKHWRDCKLVVLHTENHRVGWLRRLSELPHLETIQLRGSPNDRILLAELARFPALRRVFMIPDQVKYVSRPPAEYLDPFDPLFRRRAEPDRMPAQEPEPDRSLNDMSLISEWLPTRRSTSSSPSKHTTWWDLGLRRVQVANVCATEQSQDIANWMDASEDPLEPSEQTALLEAVAQYDDVETTGAAARARFGLLRSDPNIAAAAVMIEVPPPVPIPDTVTRTFFQRDHDLAQVEVVACAGFNERWQLQCLVPHVGSLRHGAASSSSHYVNEWSPNHLVWEH